MTAPESSDPHQPSHEPAFNLPLVIMMTAVLLVTIHGITQIVSNSTMIWILEVFAFIPAIYHVDSERLVAPASRFWSPISYFFLHGDWIHLLANLTWFAAFGSAVARRFEVVRFVLFLVLATAASALAHYISNPLSAVPMIGASGGVSACMGAAIRFGFAPNDRRSGAMRPSLSLLQSLSNPGMLMFILVWFGFNWIFGAGIVAVPGVEGQIAWEAHMGGFIFGLLAFRFFDPVGQSSSRMGLG